ncbi:hypothetical protein [Spirosoma spitsbergense]|uniref:hypothetical protein n=1 Tax=Spirosoma spitsbergense TaxID=431554 RepID=UPI00036889B1|nr:hypothetical protein [Spirosoma spitsbergense]
MNLVEGTDIEVGKWYPALVPPPELPETMDEQYVLLLGTKMMGIRLGFYSHFQQHYFWHCERYDSTSDEKVPGLSREQQINNKLKPAYERARGVAGWMLVMNLDRERESIDDHSDLPSDPDIFWLVDLMDTSEDEYSDESAKPPWQ